MEAPADDEEEVVKEAVDAGGAQLAQEDDNDETKDEDKENSSVPTSLINQRAQVADVNTDTPVEKPAALLTPAVAVEREGELTRKGGKKGMKRAAKVKNTNAEEAVGEGGSKVKRGRHA